jgi:hypothetical protein
MKVDVSTVRLLGAAQFMVFLCSLIRERLLETVVGSSGISDKLVNISNNITRIRISNLVALINCCAIITLGVLFYVVFNQQYKTIALVALGCFLAEAITLAVSKLGSYSLIPLSQEFVAAGAPESSYLKTLGNFLYNGVDRRGYDIHMLFFCLSGILWYSLLYRSGAIPPALSIWGLVALSLLTLPVLMALYNRDFTHLMILGLPYAPYEVVLGVWLILKGFN